MARITFENVKAYANNNNIRVQRKGKTIEVFLESNHGNVAVCNSVQEALEEVNSFIYYQKAELAHT